MAQLPDELKQFVEQELSAERFHSQEEMEILGLKLLQREREEVTAGIREGLASMQRGEGMPLDTVIARICEDYNIPRDA